MFQWYPPGNDHTSSSPTFQPSLLSRWWFSCSSRERWDNVDSFRSLGPGYLISHLLDPPGDVLKENHTNRWIDFQAQLVHRCSEPSTAGIYSKHCFRSLPHRESEQHIQGAVCSKSLGSCVCVSSQHVYTHMYVWMSNYFQISQWISERMDCALDELI